MRLADLRHHLLVRARGLPAAVWAAVDDADVVIHAGDWVNVELLDELTERARQSAPRAGATTTGPYAKSKAARGRPVTPHGLACP